MNDRIIAMLPAIVFVLVAALVVQMHPRAQAHASTAHAFSLGVAARAQTSACLARCQSAACALRCR